MTSGNHKIQRVIFEISNSETDNYKSDEVWFSNFFNNSLSNALEQLFEEINVDGLIINISKIEIDIGVIKKPISNENLTSLIKNTLKPILLKEVELAQQQLNSALKDEKNGSGNFKSKNEINALIKSESKNEIDILIYFLINGHLPWWANTIKTFSNINEKEFINELKATLFIEPNHDWIIRLINQYDVEDVILLLDELTNSSEKNKLSEFKYLIFKLYNSRHITLKNTAKHILRNTFKEIISRNGNIRSINDFMAEYLLEDLPLKKKYDNYTSNFEEGNSKKKLEEFLESEIYLNINSDLINQEEDTPINSKSDKELLIIYYLTHGSFPPLNYTIDRNDFEDLLSTFVVNNKSKLIKLFKEKVINETILINALEGLSPFYLKKIIESFKDSFSEDVKKIFEIVNEPKFRNDLKSFISSLVLNQILALPESIINSFEKNKSYLNEKESSLINKILFKEIENLNSIIVKNDDEAKVDSFLDYSYFLDLIFFIIEYREWPWWGKYYSDIFGQVNLKDNFQVDLNKIILNFELRHPKKFIEFCKKICEIHEPSIFFNKLGWNTSKHILNKVFPFHKNDFIETVEAILALLFSTNKSMYNSAIITQQFVYFIIDKKKLQKTQFTELINEILITVAVELNLPLWKIYNTLKSNYSKLVFNQSLTISDINFMFSYDEVLEEKYLELKEYKTNITNLNEINFTNVISGDYEVSILNYINGDDLALKIFPSNWSLGIYIIENIKKTSDLHKKLKEYLYNGNFKNIYRIILLENLTEQKWIHYVINEKENFEFYEELNNLLNRLPILNKHFLKNIIRTISLKEHFYFNTIISVQSIGVIISNLAKYTGLDSAKIENEIINELSSDDSIGLIFREYYGSPGNDISKKNSLIEGNLAIEAYANYKLYTINLIKSFDLYETQLTGQCDDLFESFNNRLELIQWIKNGPDFQNKNNLIEYFIKMDDPILFNYSKIILITELKKRILINNHQKKEQGNLIDTYIDIDLIGFQNRLNNIFEIFIKKDNRSVIKLINLLKSFSKKSDFIFWFSNDPLFSNQNNLSSYFENINSIELFNYSKDLIINELEISSYFHMNFVNSQDSNRNLNTLDYSHSLEELLKFYEKPDNNALIKLFELFKGFDTKSDLLLWLNKCPEFPSKKELLSFIEKTDSLMVIRNINETLISSIKRNLDSTKINNLLLDLKLKFSEFFLKLSDEYSSSKEIAELVREINFSDNIDIVNINIIIKKISGAELSIKIKEFIESYIKKINSIFLIIDSIKDSDSFKYNWWKEKLNFIKSSSVLAFNFDFREIVDNSLIYYSESEFFLPELDSSVNEKLKYQAALSDTLSFFKSSENDTPFLEQNLNFKISNNALIQINKLNSTIIYLEKTLIYFKNEISINLDFTTHQNIYFSNFIDTVIIVLNDLSYNLNGLKEQLYSFKKKIIIDAADFSGINYEEILLLIKNTNQIEIKFNYISNLVLQEKVKLSEIESLTFAKKDLNLNETVIDQLELSINDLSYQFIDLHNKVFSNLIIDELEIKFSLQTLSIKLDDFYKKAHNLYLQFINDSNKIENTSEIISSRFMFLFIQIKEAKRKVLDYREVFVSHLESNETFGKVLTTENPSSTEIVPDTELPDYLSDENICDIAAFFILYKELPWWSSIQELPVLEKLLQNVVINTPFAFKQKLLYLFKNQPDFIEHIIVDLKLNNNNIKNVSFVLQKDIDWILKKDLDYILSVLKDNITFSYLKPIILEIVNNIKKNELYEQDIIDIFRMSIIQFISVEKTFETITLFESENRTELQNEWFSVYNKVVKEKRINSKSGEKLFNLLLELEKKYNSKGIDNGVSITENVNSLYNVKHNFTNADVFNTWLFMLESFTGVSAQFIRKELINELNFIPIENRSVIYLKLIDIASEANNERVFIPMPFTNLVIAVSKILTNIETISVKIRESSLKIISRLFLLDEFKGNPSIPFSLLIKYLLENNVSRQQLLNTIELLLKIENVDEIKSSLIVIEDVVNGKFFDNTYLNEISKNKEIEPSKKSTFDDQINLIIQQFHEKKPIFEKIVLGKKLIKPFVSEDIIDSQKLPKKRFNLKSDARIYIPNAGLIILWPFLTRLFANLKYTQEGQFIDEEKRFRAIFLTQYLVGFTENNPEYTLMLNKLLCGLPINEPIVDVIILTEEEKIEAKNLIDSVLVHWKEMNNTSVQNFQRTFIQREGVIFQKDGDWNLIVNHSTFDIILLRLPWGLSIVKYPWNNFLIFVEWKAMS